MSETMKVTAKKEAKEDRLIYQKGILSIYTVNICTLFHVVSFKPRRDSMRPSLLHFPFPIQKKGGRGKGTLFLPSTPSTLFPSLSLSGESRKKGRERKERATIKEPPPEGSPSFIQSNPPPASD